MTKRSPFDDTPPRPGTLRFAIAEGLSAAGETKYWYDKIAAVQERVQAWIDAQGFVTGDDKRLTEAATRNALDAMRPPTEGN